MYRELFFVPTENQHHTVETRFDCDYLHVANFFMFPSDVGLAKWGSVFSALHN